MRVKVSCTERAAIVRPINGDFLSAEVATIEETRALDPEAFARAREIFEAYESFAHAATPQSLRRYAREPGVLADVLVQLMEVGIHRMQQILETGDVVARLDTILGWMREPTSAKAT